MNKSFVGLVALFALTSVSAFASQNCDPSKFQRATGCEGSHAVWSETFTRKISDGFYNYCKQYVDARGKSPFAVLTAAAADQAVVIDKSSCEKKTYRVGGADGIKEMKVVGGFAWVLANDGELYLVDARGNFFEVATQSSVDRGNPRGYVGQAGIASISGPTPDDDDKTTLHVTPKSNRPFSLTPTQVIERHQYLLVDRLND